ncbi:MAG TPA: hypothetical protein VEA37_07455, partial [Flavobacterium sp.]|nr:hypothetical protein [Flavobacterium sp.]
AFGSYILELEPDHDFFQPFRTFVKSKYIHLLFLGMLIYGFASLLDRVVLFRYGVRPLTYVAFFHIFSAIIFFTLISIFYDGFKGIKRGMAQSGRYFLVIALLTIAYRLTQSAAIKIAYVGLVAAIKRTSTLFSTIIGGTIFHEQNLLRKSIACIIMLGGAILLIT